jgi:hypothetical protein
VRNAHPLLSYYHGATYMESGGYRQLQMNEMEQPPAPQEVGREGSGLGAVVWVWKHRLGHAAVGLDVWGNAGRGGLRLGKGCGSGVWGRMFRQRCVGPDGRCLARFDAVWPNERPSLGASY